MKKIIMCTVAITVLLTGCVRGGMVEREPFEKGSNEKEYVEDVETTPEYVLPPEAITEFVKTYNEKQSVPECRVPDFYKVYLKNDAYHITDEKGNGILSIKLDSNGDFLSAAAIGSDSERNILASIAIMDSLKDGEFIPIEAKEEIQEIYRKIKETESAIEEQMKLFREKAEELDISLPEVSLPDVTLGG